VRGLSTLPHPRLAAEDAVRVRVGVRGGVRVRVRVSAPTARG
jgi:hypothetical protein